VSALLLLLPEELGEELLHVDAAGTACAEAACKPAGKAPLKAPARAAAQTRLALNLIPLYATLAAPFIPDAAAKMLAGMKIADAGWPDEVPAAVAQLPAGHAFEVPEVLFAKITDEQREEWAERFAGKRD
jgi:methionyl-tRNA synthetase